MHTTSYDLSTRKWGPLGPWAVTAGIASVSGLCGCDRPIKYQLQVKPLVTNFKEEDCGDGFGEDCDEEGIHL